MNLKSYIDSSDPFIAKLAKKADDLHKAKEFDQINQKEFEELAADLFDLAKINEAATSLEHKIVLQQAVESIMKLIGFMRSVV